MAPKYLALLAWISAMSLSSATLYREDPEHLKALWESFKNEFKRAYETIDEENFRFKAFIQALKSADERNANEKALNGNAIHGITKFSDLTQAEFEAKFLTAVPVKQTDAKVDSTVRSASKDGNLVDWTGIYTTPVKDQGECGSCWAVSAVEQIESDAMRLLSFTSPLSVEQVIQCDSNSAGCNGGYTDSAFKYVEKAGGIETAADYPYSSYSGTTGRCVADKSKFVVSVNSYTKVVGESNMGTYVQSTGPLSVCVDASSWSTYSAGVMSYCGTNVNHCVQAVGVDTSGVGGYWKVKNSWGTSWGESGFIRLAYGKNTCGITWDPLYSDVKLTN